MEHPGRGQVDSMSYADPARLEEGAVGRRIAAGKLENRMHTTRKGAAILLVVMAVASGSAFAKGDAARGKGEAEVCMTCHGPGGMSLSDTFPNLAGQKYAYLVEQLEAFRGGTRVNPLMSQQARSLSSRGIEDLAAYFSSLDPRTAAQTAAQPAPAVRISHPPIVASPRFVAPHRHPTRQSWVHLLPPGRGRDILATNCQFCHDLQRAIAFDRTRERWRQIVGAMHERGSPIRPEEVPVLVAYLTKNFGLDSPSVKGPGRSLIGMKPCTRSEWPKGSADFRRNWQGSYNIWASNQQGGNIDVIDPVTLHIVDVIQCISAPDRAEFSRDGNTAYVPDRVEHDLTVIDTRTGAIRAKVPLIDRPNTSVLSRDHKKLYIAIWPVRPTEKTRGYVQVVDTRTLKVVKTIVTKGAIHDVWMSHDGRLLLAMSPAGEFMNVYDTTRNDKLLYTCCSDGEIGTMNMEPGPDGHTMRIFISYSGFQGIVAVDPKTGKELERVAYPRLKGTSAAAETYFHGIGPGHGGSGFHGGEISRDGRNYWVISSSTVWRYSLPGLKYLGHVELAQDDQLGDAFKPAVEGTWLTISPDGNTVYAVRPGRDLLSVIDAKTMKEVAQVPTGEYPLHISIWPRGTP
jgi:YVTN family beta-propeller protein